MSPPVALADVPALDASTVYVWGCRLEVWEPHITRLSEMVSPEELERAHRFHSARDRDRHIIGRSVLRMLAARELKVSPKSVVLRRGAHGKPHVETGTQAFGVNLSHSGCWVLISMARVSDIGVDVERLDASVEIDVLSKSLFSTWEHQTLKTLPTDVQQDLFFEIWTRKEAVIKADGRGLTFGLDSFDVEFRPDSIPNVRVVKGASNHNWNLYCLNLDTNHAAAVAWRGPASQVRGGRLLPGKYVDE